VTREGGTALADVRVTQRRRLKPFSLRGEEVSAELEEELNTLVRDLTSRRVGGGRAPVRERTAMNHVAVAKQFMGWLCRESEHASEFATLSVDGRVVLRPGVSLRDAFPKRESVGAKYAIEYVQWLSDERRIKSTTEDFQLRSLVALAKWVHAFVEDDGIAPPCVQELVRVQRSARDRAKNAPHAADDDRKWLEWDQYLALVEHLKLECAPLDCNGKERSEREIAMSVQRYLLFAILACIPDRQRTLRELQLNKTLFRDASTGAWMVRHGSDDYKTGGAYGERPALVIDSRVYPALESWLSTHRAALSPSHDFVFTRPNGTPWTVSELSRTFSRAALRVTGQKTNPHLIRDMIDTHVRSRGIASDAELEALARFMGHSSAMQKSTYDRRTTQEKVNPALSLMANVNAAAPPSRPASAPS
jgi:integrase